MKVGPKHVYTEQGKLSNQQEPSKIAKLFSAHSSPTLPPTRSLARRASQVLEGPSSQKLGQISSLFRTVFTKR
jgi:hypothetical protein